MDQVHLKSQRSEAGAGEAWPCVTPGPWGRNKYYLIARETVKSEKAALSSADVWFLVAFHLLVFPRNSELRRAVLETDGIRPPIARTEPRAPHWFVQSTGQRDYEPTCFINYPCWIALDACPRNACLCQGTASASPSPPLDPRDAFVHMNT